MREHELKFLIDLASRKDADRAGEKATEILNWELTRLGLRTQLEMRRLQKALRAKPKAKQPKKDPFDDLPF